MIDHIPTADAVYQWEADPEYRLMNCQVFVNIDRPFVSHVPVWADRFAIDFTHGEVDVNQCPACGEPTDRPTKNVCERCSQYQGLHTRA